MIMRYTTELAVGCHCEQDCFGLFYEVLNNIPESFGSLLYAVCVSLLTLPPSWKLETRARLRFGSASPETGIAAWHGTIACVLQGLTRTPVDQWIILCWSERVGNLQAFPYQTVYNILDTYMPLLASTYRVKAGNLPIVVRN